MVLVSDCGDSLFFFPLILAVVENVRGYKRERRSAQLTKILHHATRHTRGRRTELSLFVYCVVALLRENCLRDHSSSSAL